MPSYEDEYKLPVSWVVKEAIKFILVIGLVVVIAFIAVACGA